MHGVIRSAEFDEQADKGWFSRVRDALHPFRWFGLFVVLPTLLAAAYYYLIASDQYETTADFVVRRSESTPKGGLGGGLGQVLGFDLGTSQSEADAMIVAQYLQSQNTVRVLREQDRLVERFTRPGIDFLSRLRWDNPKPEQLHKYYKKYVAISQDPDTNIMHVSVRAFTPQDSFAITRKLLALGEQRVNYLNERSFNDQIATSRQQLAEAEQSLNETLARVTQFRRTRNDIDPASTGKAQITMVSTAEGQLIAARAKMENVGRVISRSSPQYRAVASEVRALESQVASERSQLAGSGTSIAAGLGDYEDLMVRKEFATQRYTVAAAAHQQAKAEAVKQQLYVIRIVDPEMPVKPLYPERGKMVITIFFAMLGAYAIGWLLAAGVKEHSL
jgi:capsular polysaccharide transport system permease protein